jgi:hypothetical protein
MTQRRGAMASTLQPMLSNSASGTSTRRMPRRVSQSRKRIGISGE